MAADNSTKPYKLDDLVNATKELAHAQGVLADKKNITKRYRDAIKSFEKDEIEAEAEVARRIGDVKKIAGNLEK